jgi:hypothetical protein
MRRVIIGVCAALVLGVGALVAREISWQRRTAAVMEEDFRSGEGDAINAVGRWHAEFTLRERRLLLLSRARASFRGTLEIRELRAPNSDSLVLHSGAQLAAVLYADLDSMPGAYPDTLAGWASVGASGNLYLTLGRACADCGNLVFELRPTDGHYRGSWMQETLAHEWAGPAVIRRP